ncbi:MAG: 50S ribosomal protein L23 [Bdellovibrionales bacterium]|nr:50S ribosomal protein L23 [Bdellovibrionales bacterium]
MATPKKKTSKKSATKSGGLLSKKKAKSESEKREAGISDYAVLLKPVITEKGSLASEQGNNVIFLVDPAATKTQIQQAVERIFKVEVSAVRTCNYIGKVKRTTRAVGRRAGFKKAYVSLREGQSIDIVEGV